MAEISYIVFDEGNFDETVFREILPILREKEGSIDCNFPVLQQSGREADTLEHE